MFCVCKGSNPSGFFVACEAGTDCPHNGWLHPECTEDLRNKTQDFIDNLGPWYCQSCTKLSSVSRTLETQNSNLGACAAKTTDLNYFRLNRMNAEEESE